MALAGCWAAAGEETKPNSPGIRVFLGTPVPYRVVPMETFSAFVKDWDDGDAQLHRNMFHTAVIRNLDDWNEVFAPAVVMGDDRLSAPDEAVFEYLAFLVVARITPPVSEEEENPLSVAALRKNSGGNLLELSYRYDPEPTLLRGDMRAKSVLLVAVPKEEIPAEGAGNEIRFSQVFDSLYKQLPDGAHE